MDSTAYIGEIKIVSQSFAPRGWAFCNGQLLQIQQNQALFSILGTVYGGNGTTTFALPDLRGRTPLGFSPATPLGQSAGVQSQVLIPDQLPMHNHTLNVNNAEGNTPAPANAYFANAGTGDNDYSTAVADVTMSTSFLTTVGSSQPLPVMQPYLALNFIIALQGIYPSRN